MKLLINNINYDDIDFKWIIDHYDIHRQGTCYYNNQIHYFIVTDGGYYDEWDVWIDGIAMIFSLSLVEKIKYIIQQALFEIRYGLHLSYFKNSKILKSKKNGNIAQK